MAIGDLLADDHILVTCGGDTDALALRGSGARNVTITNLDDRRNDGIGGYPWRHADAEDLPFDDHAFDWGMIHAGLHHCRSPHRALLELLRVCRKGVLVIEARDSAVMRLAVGLGFTPDYEIEDVALDRHGLGGLRNTGIPNYIYRWTEREVRKTVESAYPATANSIRFFYGLSLPDERLTMASRAKRILYWIASAVMRAAFAIAPKQGNRFAFVIMHQSTPKPWIAEAGLNPSYVLGFDPARYVKETT